ncbi:MAG: hypothetical protein VZS44_11390 [Bacilli bacterium]|nr:hypothetical protein [Bacilli bacterium]
MRITILKNKTIIFSSGQFAKLKNCEDTIKVTLTDNSIYTFKNKAFNKIEIKDK